MPAYTLSLLIYIESTISRIAYLGTNDFKASLKCMSKNCTRQIIWINNTHHTPKTIKQKDRYIRQVLGRGLLFIPVLYLHTRYYTTVQIISKTRELVDLSSEVRKLFGGINHLTYASSYWDKVVTKYNMIYSHTFYLLNIASYLVNSAC